MRTPLAGVAWLASLLLLSSPGSALGDATETARAKTTMTVERNVVKIDHVVTLAW